MWLAFHSQNMFRWNLKISWCSFVKQTDGSPAVGHLVQNQIGCICTCTSLPFRLCISTRIMLCMHPANERWRYIAHTQNDDGHLKGEWYLLYFDHNKLLYCEWPCWISIMHRGDRTDRHVTILWLCVMACEVIHRTPNILFLMTSIGDLNGVSVHEVSHKCKAFRLLYLCELFD